MLRNFKSFTFVAALFATSALSSHAFANSTCDAFPSTITEKLFQLHSDGSIFVKNDKPCDNRACFGSWFLLDNNPHTVEIAANCELYQRHDDGSVFYYTGDTKDADQCGPNAGFCGNWSQIDSNPQTKMIVAGRRNTATVTVYQMHADGSIFMRNGKPCGEAQCFGGWDSLDRNPHTITIAVGDAGLFQLHDDGNIYRWDGKTSCDDAGCPGWALIDQKGGAKALTVGSELFKVNSDNSIWRRSPTAPDCTPVSPSEACPGWEQIDVANADTVTVKAGRNGIVKLQRNGSILGKGGLVDSNFADWRQINSVDATDPNLADAITAGAAAYQHRRSDRSVWMFQGGDPKLGWSQLDNNSATSRIVVNGSVTLP